MGAYTVFYALWAALAWGIVGIVVFLLVLVAAVAFVTFGIAQLRHAASFPQHPSQAQARLSRAMGLLNSVTHPIWMLGVLVLLVLEQGRWVLPLMVFVIGAHFLPMAGILGRRIDYLLGPVAIAGAVTAGVLALDPEVSWLTVFAVAGVGGAAATLGYAIYMVLDYRRLCDRAGVQRPGRR